MPYLLLPPGKAGKTSVATGAGKEAQREIKEWQASIADGCVAVRA